MMEVKKVPLFYPQVKEEEPAATNGTWKKIIIPLYYCIILPEVLSRAGKICFFCNRERQTWRILTQIFVWA